MSHDPKPGLHKAGAKLNGSSGDRTTQPSTCNIHVPNDAQENPALAARSNSPRTEQRQRNLATARDDAAAIWSRVRRAHVLNEDPLASNERIAWACGIDEKDVRRWGANEKPLVAAIALVPGISATLVEDFFDELLSERRELSGDAYSIVALGRAVQRCTKHANSAPFTKERRQAYAEALRRFADEVRSLADETEVG